MRYAIHKCDEAFVELKAEHEQIKKEVCRCWLKNGMI